MLISSLRYAVFLLCAAMLSIAGRASAFDGFGVNASPFTTAEAKATEAAFPLLQAAGVQWVRLAFRWSEIESERGEFDFREHDALVALARKHGMRVVGVIVRAPRWASGSSDPAAPPRDMAAWRGAVSTIAAHYEGAIRHWQIWNEPDIRKFWSGTQQEYLGLIAAAYAALKMVDPDTQVVSAGLDGRGEEYLEGLLEGGMDAWCDIISFHPYAATPERVLQRTLNFLSRMKKRRVTRPLWITEIGWQAGGWPDGPGMARDEQQKAEHLVRVFELLAPYAEAVFWYRAVEGPRWYGLLEQEGGKVRMLPAYSAFQRMASENRVGER